jgi:hypothetical protein
MATPRPLHGCLVKPSAALRSVKMPGKASASSAGTLIGVAITRGGLEASRRRTDSHREPTVAVVVEEGRAGRPSAAGHACSPRYIRKGAVAAPVILYTKIWEECLSRYGLQTQMPLNP